MSVIHAECTYVYHVCAFTHDSGMTDVEIVFSHLRELCEKPSAVQEAHIRPKKGNGGISFDR